MQSVFAWASSCSDASAMLASSRGQRPVAGSPLFFRCHTTTLILHCFHPNHAPLLPLSSSYKPIRRQFSPVSQRPPPVLSPFLGWCDKCKLFFSQSAISFDGRLFLRSILHVLQRELLRNSFPPATALQDSFIDLQRRGNSPPRGRCA